jgi:hypothetical protein
MAKPIAKFWKSWKPWILGLLILLVLVFAGNLFLKSKIESTLREVKGLEFSAIEIHLLNGTVALENIYFKKDSGNYHFTAKRAFASYWDKKLELDSFHLVPKYDEKTWSEKIKYRNGRVDLSLPKILVDGLDFKRIYDEQYFWADKVTLEKGILDVWINQNKPVCPACYKPFPQEQLLALEQKITVPEVEVIDSDILIRIYDEGSGRAEFKKVNGIIKNISNDSLEIQKNEIVFADVETRFRNEPALKVHFEFPLNSKAYPYNIDAWVGPMDLVSLNSIFDMDNSFSIKEGNLKTARIRINGNNRIAKGDIEMDYTGLKINLKNEDNKVKGILSGLANFLFFNNKKDDASEGSKKGNIHYPRKRNRSFYHQWVGAIKTGLRSAVMPDLLLPEELDKKEG